MSRLPAMLIVAALIGLLWWAFPPFHLRSLKEVNADRDNQQFDASEFAGRFWTNGLIPAVDIASDAGEVLERIANDPKAVRQQFGHTVGVGDSYFLFLRGVGRVVQIDEDRVGLSLKPDGDEVQMVIELGFVFGNAVRDATGLIRASDYPNAQEFNDIAAALDLIVETKVLPDVKQLAQIGRKIQFAGCVEVGDDGLDLKPLKLVPVLVKSN